MLPAQSQTNSNHFSSNLGFTLSYTSAWSRNILGDFPLLTAKDLDKSVLQDPEKRSIGCTQKIFFVKQGQPSTNFLVNALPNDCLGKVPAIEPFVKRIEYMNLSGFATSSVNAAEFTVGSQHFWVFKADGYNKVTRTGGQTVEYVVTQLPKGILSFYVEGNGHAITEFERSTLKLDNGVETQLIPATAHFAPLVLPNNENARQLSGSNPQSTSKYPHQLKSDLGFTYEFASGLQLIDPEYANRDLHARESQASTADKHSISCANLLGMGIMPDMSRSVSIIAFDFNCLGYSEGQQQDDALASKMHVLGEYGITTLRQKFILSNVKSAEFKVDGHPGWGMLGSITPTASAMPAGYLARMIFPLKGKMVEITMTAKRQEDLTALMKTIMLFTDGTSSELFPADAVMNATPIPAPQ